MTRVYYDEGGIRITSDSLVVPGLTCAMKHVLWANIEHDVNSNSEAAADAITSSITTYPDPAEKFQHHTIHESNRQRANRIARALNDAVEPRYERVFRQWIGQGPGFPKWPCAGVRQAVCGRRSFS